ncbi:DUF2293 domain-containing protein [Aurantimonas aggregata]|uniref:DUF2293 domain-containing protein n=1 Tax=Aurantimonas aggregata TaxID=2047720 RepID=A0A6L9MCZ2_9HYPH|nr:DUF2293 domain-containing protein [Aurantimonas aggregata]
MATERQKRIARALTALIPRAPFIDAEAIRAAARSRHMRPLPSERAIWLAAISHIRHAHTDYDELMDDGYDRDAARYFVLDDINAVLDRWGATRRLDPDVSDDTSPEDTPDADEQDESDPDD